MKTYLGVRNRSFAVSVARRLIVDVATRVAIAELAILFLVLLAFLVNALFVGLPIETLTQAIEPSVVAGIVVVALFQVVSCALDWANLKRRLSRSDLTLNEFLALATEEQVRWLKHKKS